MTEEDVKRHLAFRKELKKLYKKYDLCLVGDDYHCVNLEELEGYDPETMVEGITGLQLRWLMEKLGEAYEH